MERQYLPVSLTRPISMTQFYIPSLPPCPHPALLDSPPTTPYLDHLPAILTLLLVASTTHSQHRPTAPPHSAMSSPPIEDYLLHPVALPPVTTYLQDDNCVITSQYMRIPLPCAPPLHAAYLPLSLCLTLRSSDTPAASIVRPIWPLQVLTL